MPSYNAKATYARHPTDPRYVICCCPDAKGEHCGRGRALGGCQRRGTRRGGLGRTKLCCLVTVESLFSVMKSVDDPRRQSMTAQRLCRLSASNCMRFFGNQMNAPRTSEVRVQPACF
jgi:hypothetical protein